MKYKLVLNGCSSSLPTRARQLYKFALDNLDGWEAEATVIIHAGRVERQWLTDNAFTRRVILIKIAGGHPETALKVLPEYCRDVDLLLFPGDYFGDELAVRLACRLGGGSLVAAGGLKVEGGRILCEKKVYSQQLRASFEMAKSPACVSIARGGGEEPFSPDGVPDILEADHSQQKLDFMVSSQFRKEEKADDLAQARRLVVAGKGIGSREEVGRLEEFAEAIDARLGVSRPVAMNAWAPLNKLVGVSGAMTRPELCLTFGASGASALYAGIEKSKFIISINRDNKAPIIRQSDVAVIDDCVAVLEELRQLVAEQK